MRISLITASYNRANTIRDTLRSVNDQTYEDIEHIVMDGASKDDTMQIVADEGRRVTFAVSEPDNGVFDAYNKGLDRASGEIIGFINTDDFYCSTSVISEVMAAFAANPLLEGVHADLVYVDVEDTKKILRHWRGRDYGPEDIRRGFIPAHPTVFLRRSVYDRVGRFDTSFRYAADYDFLLRAFYGARITAIYVPQVWVRMRAGGVTGGALSSIVAQNREIRRAQEACGVSYPRVAFIGHKLIDRSLQKLRAPFVQMPDARR